jgi:hypothetical protein
MYYLYSSTVQVHLQLQNLNLPQPLNHCNHWQYNTSTVLEHERTGKGKSEKRMVQLGPIIRLFVLLTGSRKQDILLQLEVLLANSTADG